MKFSIKFTEEGKKSLHSLHIENQNKIKFFIKKLSDDENLGKPLLGGLIGFYSLHIGKYRVIYSIEKETIIIYYVGHRRDVYEKAERIV